MKRQGTPFRFSVSRPLFACDRYLFMSLSTERTRSNAHRPRYWFMLRWSGGSCETESRKMSERQAQSKELRRKVMEKPERAHPQSVM